MALTVSLDDIVSSGNSLLAIKPHWQRVRLGDVGQVLNGFAFKAELFTREGGMPLIRIRDVGSAASETFYSGDYDERYVVNAGDLLVGMDGDFNCARWRGPRSLLNQRVCKITVDEALYLPRFLDYALPGYLKAINDATSSITVKHLSSRTIQDIPLPLPPMEEQREIVAELEKQFSRLDEAVANLQRVKANLKRYKASVLKAAVEGRLVETEATLALRAGRTYETGEQLLQRTIEARTIGVKARRANAVPAALTSADKKEVTDGWVWTTTGQLCECIVPNRDKPKTFSGDIPWLTLPDFDDSEIAVARSKSGLGFTESEVALYRAKVIPSDSVVMSCVGRFGISAVLTRKAVINQQLHAFLPSEGVVPKYLAYVLRTREQEMLEKSTATTIAYLNKENCNSVSLPLPPLAEQTRIVAEVDRHLSIIREVESEVDSNLKRAQALRQATLAKAFS